MYTHCTTADVAMSQILAVLSADTVSICRLSGLTHTCQSDRQTDRQTQYYSLTHSISIVISRLATANNPCIMFIQQIPENLA